MDARLKPAPDADPGAGHDDWAATRALNRDGHHRAQAPEGAVGEADVTAMAVGDVAGDREPEPGAAFILVARIIQPHERPEHRLALAGRDARTIVVDGHEQMPALAPG